MSEDTKLKSQILKFLEQFQYHHENITGMELNYLRAQALRLRKELTKEQVNSNLDEIKIKFATNKEYNIMWETTILLLIIDILNTNIHPTLSVVIPTQELQEIKNKLREWINKLSNIIEVINP